LGQICPQENILLHATTVAALASNQKRVVKQQYCPVAEVVLGAARTPPPFGFTSHFALPYGAAPGGAFVPSTYWV